MFWSFGFLDFGFAATQTRRVVDQEQVAAQKTASTCAYIAVLHRRWPPGPHLYVPYGLLSSGFRILAASGHLISGLPARDNRTHLG